MCGCGCGSVGEFVGLEALINALKKMKKRFEDMMLLCQVVGIKGAAPLRVLLESVIRRLFFYTPRSILKEVLPS